MIHCYKTSGGKNVIVSFINKLEKRDREDLLALLAELEKDILGTLSTVKTRKIKDPVLEIKLNSVRIFYALKDSDIYLLHACMKQKNKTESKDKECALKRAKQSDLI